RMLDRRRWVIAGAAVVLAACIGGIFIMDVDTAYVPFFPDAPPVQIRYRDISKNLVGAMPLMIVVDTHRPDGVKDPAVLADVDKLSQFMRQRWDKVIGYSDFVTKLHMEMNGG